MIMTINKKSEYILLGIYESTDFSAPIEYILNLLISTYGITYQIMSTANLNLENLNLEETLVISYGNTFLNIGVGKQIHIYSSDFFGKNYLKPGSMPKSPLSRFNNLPIIYKGTGRFDDWVKESDDLIETNIDIIASSFFMVSRYEELVIDIRDHYDRFPARASLAYKEGFLDRPIVNEYVELLWGWIQSLKPELKRKSLWPDNKAFAVCLTHDVDRIRLYGFPFALLYIGARIVKHRKLKEAINMAVDYIKVLAKLKKDPFDTFDYMLNIEQGLGSKSSFFFLAGKSRRDFADTVKRKSVVRLIRNLEKKGCEIGLHPSLGSYNNPQLMVDEKRELDKIVINNTYGCRQHYLRFKVPVTWNIQQEVGLLYDSTLSFADHAGFRCGLCIPFQPFNVLENRPLSIWELPLTVMEGSLQDPSYQNLPPEEAYEEIIKLIVAAKKHGGVFVLLWHNSSFDAYSGWAGWKEVYDKVMEYISEQNAWVTSGREIVQWWQQSHL